MKNVAILGSTGSIGINTLKVIESLSKGFRVVGLSSFSNIGLLQEQIRIFKPSLVTVVDSKKGMELKPRIDTRRIKLFSGAEGLNIIASSKDVDIVVIAISGAAAIYPLLSSIDSKKHICLANKESIVMAGDIIMKRAAGRGANLIPVDSEHSAIFQCINSSAISSVNKIYLTGSGGSLFKTAKVRFPSLKVNEVLKHPKWKMGKKVTVDSATLMNKGLEIMEAQHLFKVPVDKIKLLIHPEAIIHSMVEFIDGAIMAQLGVTDMRLPIQYALTYPERVKTSMRMVDFSDMENLTFHKPDMAKYPCLSLAIATAKLGDTYPAVLNAADEEAVKAFLAKRINFVKIPKIIEKVLMKHHPVKDPCLDDIFKSDEWAREEAQGLC
ncbi:MAG: 1-deoxy-D-xylulose-5-phosphate reductoisomerase [Candidatus Omnitrophota bacterium]